MNNKITYLTVFILVCIYGFKVVQSVSPDSIDSRIYGGYPITINYAPYQVSVRLKKGEAEKFGFGHICGGSVITTRVVLTAAHCIAVSVENPLKYRSPNEFTLVMGDTYLTKKDSQTRQFSVLQIVVHPNFNTSLYNDLALMFFDGKVPDYFGSAVRPIALNTLSLPMATICKVSGWGKINSYQISDNLMEATVPIVEHKICEKNYGFLPQSMVCAGFMSVGGTDACQGDSGGPLVCNNLLAGIVSWGVGCAEPGYPGIYTKVSYYTGWIESTNATFNYSYYVAGSVLIQRSLILLVFCGIISLIK